MGARSVLWISAAAAMTGFRRAGDDGGGLPRLAALMPACGEGSYWLSYGEILI